MKRCMFTIFLFISLLLIWTLPCLAGERTVFGINAIVPGLFSIEWENDRNDSWLVGGFVYGVYNHIYDGSNVEMNLFAGRRFYKGDNAGRPYAGFYGNFDFEYFDAAEATEHILGKAALYGVFGYEWRLGQQQNTRLIIETGMHIGVPLEVQPFLTVGFGFNL